MKQKKEKRYILTGFYCDKCKVWHHDNDEEFYACLNQYNTHYGFEVEPSEK